jgi:hypothetical protein
MTRKDADDLHPLAELFRERRGHAVSRRGGSATVVNITDDYDEDDPNVHHGHSHSPQGHGHSQRAPCAAIYRFTTGERLR